MDPVQMRKDGGSAFPTGEMVASESAAHSYRPGMSLRDYFAAQALQGLLVAQSNLDDSDEESVSWALSCGIGEELSYHHSDGKPYTWEEMLAENCYGLADAMLAERNKP